MAEDNISRLDLNEVHDKHLDGLALTVLVTSLSYCALILSYHCHRDVLAYNYCCWM